MVRILLECFFVTSDITVTSTLIRELMNKVDQLNKTVVELQENNTALEEKVKVMEGTETNFFNGQVKESKFCQCQSCLVLRSKCNFLFVS